MNLSAIRVPSPGIARHAQPFRHDASMKHSSSIHFALCALFLTLCAFASSQTALAAPKDAASANRSAPAQPALISPEDLSDITPDGASAVAGNVSEVQDLLKAGSLAELRSARNGSYGAQLYFLPRELVYYVVLAQETRLWRVVKTQDEARAESVYAQFSRKSFELAAGEIRRTQLQAQTALLDRVIAVSADRASRLSADLQLAQQQDVQVSERQQKLQAESLALQSGKAEAERKLRALRLQVDQLQRESEAGLSPPPAAFR
jgi:ribosomal protein L22